MSEDPTLDTTKEELSPVEEPQQDDFKDKYLRLLAENENIRKRLTKEKIEATKFAIEDLLSEILTPLDSLEQALSFTENASGEVKNWALGFQMILGQFKEVLTEKGVTPFSSLGEKFDPHKHEAVETEESSAVPEGTILQEFVRGYQRGERIIRPARVKVSIAKKQETL